MLHRQSERVAAMAGGQAALKEAERQRGRIEARNQPSGGAQSLVGEFKQLGGLLIIQMMEHARGQNQVKSALLSLNSSQAYVTAQEAPRGSEALLCRTDTFRANVESRVVAAGR